MVEPYPSEKYESIGMTIPNWIGKKMFQTINQYMIFTSHEDRMLDFMVNKLVQNMLQQWLTSMNVMVSDTVAVIFIVVRFVNYGE